MVQLAINFPPLTTSPITSIAASSRLMYAQLISSNGIASGSGSDTMKQIIFSTYDSKTSSPLWQLYYADENGFVSGVSRSKSPTDQNDDNYFECWSSIGGDKPIVARTNSSSIYCNTTLMNDINDHGSSTIRRYNYDARGRPWYKLAMSKPNQVVWTQPYVFSSTGYVGVTAALYTKVGWKTNSNDSGASGKMGVFGIDVTLQTMEKFLNIMSKLSIKSNTFGSYPAELAILRNFTVEEFQARKTKEKDPSKKRIIVASEHAKNVLNDFLHSNDQLIDNAASESKLETITIKDYKWFAFCGMQNIHRWLVVGFIKRSIIQTKKVFTIILNKSIMMFLR